MKKYKELKESIDVREREVLKNLQEFYHKHIEHEFNHATEQDKPQFPFKIRIPIHISDDGIVGVSVIRKYFVSFGYMSTTVSKSTDGYIYVGVSENGTKLIRKF